MAKSYQTVTSIGKKVALVNGVPVPKWLLCEVGDPCLLIPPGYRLPGVLWGHLFALGIATPTITEKHIGLPLLRRGSAVIAFIPGLMYTPMLVEDDMDLRSSLGIVPAKHEGSYWRSL